ncbi:unnamed protein product [Onchocerca flexuosa]|uniref:Myosin_tail_1 domain-containing protein n=1 Tax=Onchocerca flexuosa TaxID=387005 RepID=A0A183HPF5_9BILA|nr:unnamed protein product [Onchocerca flexuosa]
MLENNLEREEEMERLRIELVEATKIAQQLFSVSTNNHKVDQSNIAQMQCKIVALNETVSTLNSEIKKHEMEKSELERNLEMKDVENQKVNAELKRLRGELFGSAEVEISRLEKQLNFREQQIEKLTARCSLLQVELNSAFDASDQKLVLGKSKITKSEITSGIEREKYTEDDDVNARREIREIREIKEKEEKHVEDEIDEIKESDVEKKTHSEVLKIHKRPKYPGKKQAEYEKGLESLEASAMIISSLNHELMLLMQVLILIFISSFSLLKFQNTNINA